MVISQTPFRMSFFGGGTDIPDYFKEYGGSVLSTTFDKFCYVTTRYLPSFFEYKTHLTYSKTEFINNLEEIQHPAIRNAMKWFEFNNLRITYESDLPARSGLGTSSSFAVGMLQTFYALKEKYADKKRLADDAIYLERVLCKEEGGYQDQIAASYGGLNKIDFSSEGYSVKPLVMSSNRKKLLNDHLLLFFTGFSRYSSDIQKGAKTDYKKKISDLHEIKRNVDIAQEILLNSDTSLDSFGELLHDSWCIKRNLSNGISNSDINNLYDRAINSGATGGKLLGAGGGGFLLFYVKPEYQKNVREKLTDLLEVPFHFENEGSKIIYFNPNLSGDKK